MVFSLLFFWALNKHLLKGPVDKKASSLHLLQKIYFAAKHMILNRTCAIGQDLSFIVDLSHFYKNLIANGFEEMARNEFEFALDLSKQVILSNPDFPPAYLLQAEMEFQQSNYKISLKMVNIGQELCTLTCGNARGLNDYYQLRTKCYICLGEKKLAKQALKYIKRFEKSDQYVHRSKIIDELENGIKSMSENKESQRKEKKILEEVRTRTICSWQKCQKIESKPGQFKYCSRCRLKYYCSRKCQAKHWKNGHKEECKES